MNVLILGESGMLGNAVTRYFRTQTQHDVSTASRESTSDYKLDASQSSNEQLISVISHTKPDYIINCIGIINKYCNDGHSDRTVTAVKVNVIFPFILADASSPKISETFPFPSRSEITRSCAPRFL